MKNLKLLKLTWNRFSKRNKMLTVFVAAIILIILLDTIA
tara:strand:- start:160 stop:276 length:117 start_codon:yes stop_codon:yes gene_type:complete